MHNSPDAVTISTTTSLKDFFRTELANVVDEHQVDVSEDTLWYLTHLLYNYRRADQFFDYHADGGTLTPLTEYYRQAVEATSAKERRLHLQRLGDVSIFVSSLFSGALEKKTVNVEYYISMGETAYGFLADTAGNSSRDRALAEIFTDLSQRFCALVTAMADIAGQSRTDESLLTQVLAWEQTQCPKLARRLESRGVVLSLITPISH